MCAKVVAFAHLGQRYTKKLRKANRGVFLGVLCHVGRRFGRHGIIFNSSSASSNLFEKKRSLSKRPRKSATTSGGVLAGRTIAGACSRFFLVSSFCPHRKKKIPEYQLNIQLEKVAT
jgi:hypothetical protein